MGNKARWAGKYHCPNCHAILSEGSVKQARIEVIGSVVLVLLAATTYLFGRDIPPLGKIWEAIGYFSVIVMSAVVLAFVVAFLVISIRPKKQGRSGR